MATARLRFLSITLLIGCAVPDDVEVTEVEEPVIARPVGNDLGPRRFTEAPTVRSALCPDQTRCLTIDFNRDGKDDLVRIDPAGVAGASGSVSVALSNGWTFGDMETVASNLCPQGDECFVTDVTGDRRPDVVRFHRVGKGMVGVAASSEGGLKPLKVWSSAFCAAGETCTAADLTGDGTAELIAYAGTDDAIRVYAGGKAGAIVKTWITGLCHPQQRLCRFGDVDGDHRADLISFDRNPVTPRAWVARSDGSKFLQAKLWSGTLPATAVCPAGALCSLGDFDGDFAADVIATFPIPETGSPTSCAGSCGGSADGCFCDDLCTQYGDCCSDYAALCVEGKTCEESCGGAAPGGCWCDALCTQYGDCCGDYEPACNGTDGMVQIWSAEEGQFGAAYTLRDTGCTPGARCWTADITGDGRTDLVTLYGGGVIAVFPSGDRLDRMADAAMRLSMLRSDFAWRQTQWRQREIDSIIAQAIPPSPALAAALPDRFPVESPPATPSPSLPELPIGALPGNEPWPALQPGAIDRAWAEDRLVELGALIEAEALAVLDAVPAEGSLTWTADQQRWHAALGRVVAARTAIYAPPLAASEVTRGRCFNGVLHDRFEDDDGTLRVEGSYLDRYYDAFLVHDEDERIWTALPALTGIVEGMRCLSGEELLGLEAAFVEAVRATMQDLVDREQIMLAELLWDQAQPVVLILFDGAKYLAQPQGWRFLQMRIDGGDVVLPELPAAGADFAAYYVEDGSTCATVRCQLYKRPTRDALLTLDTFGAWLPDLTERERLRRSSLNPMNLLDAMVDLRRLGEGDCALIELSYFEQTCKSRRTCEMSDELAAMPNDLGLALLPGHPGSEFTHLGTRRSDLATVNGCGSDGGGGGSAPMDCVGPMLRGPSGRFAPFDPELDHIMQCTLESFAGSTPTVEVVPVEMQLDPRCLLSQPEEGDSPPPEPPAVKDEELVAARDAARELLSSNTGEAHAYGYDRERIARVIAERTGAPIADVLAAMQWVADNPLGPGASIQLVEPGKASMQTSVRTAGPDNTGPIVSMELQVDVDQLEDDVARLPEGTEAEYLIRGVLHESIHMTVHRLADQSGRPLSDWQPLHHVITRQLGLVPVARSCGPDQPCSDVCGFSDARMQRFTECISTTGDVAPPDECELVEDYCENREEGSMMWDAGPSCGAPNVSFPPMCAVVQCDTGSAVATECCGTSSGGDPPPEIYRPTSPGPGPCPGDPDGWFGGIPGGPGGAPFPPLYPPPPGM